ncbi:MAG: redoxin domain-containing protein [Anaerolineales bacterium]
MKRFFTGFLLLLLTACSTSTQSTTVSLPKANASLPDLGLAPELTNTTWLNVDSPLRLATLRGKVVALEMWTFACINCQHVMPSLKAWHTQYAEQGLVIIGNHFPEFSFEEDLANLKDAVKENDIQYAVTQDNDGATWKAYKNQYWPTLYLIDKNGHIRYVHIGEGGYSETEAAIQTLLAESN